jgi:RNA polymerase sigma-70 factor (ECF subfamily)
MTTMSAGATVASATATAPDADPMTDAHVAPPASADQRMQALYRAHARPLYRFLLRITFGDPQAAEDLLQETLLRAWRHLDGLPAEADTLRSWLFTVGRRRAPAAPARSRSVSPTSRRCPAPTTRSSA